MNLNNHNKVQEYIGKVSSRIKNHRVHEEIKIELIGHIEEIAFEHLSTGVSENEAIERAINQMGEPELVGKQLNKIHKPQPEWIILSLTAIFACVGLMVMYFIETKGALINNYQLFDRTLVSTLLGLALVLGLYFFDYRKIQAYSKYLYTGTFLVMLFVISIGREVNGAKAWLTIGPFSFNFVAVSPFLFIIALAGLFANWNWHEPKKVLSGLALSLVPTILMLSAPSFSAAAMYSIAIVTLMIVSGIQLKYVPIIVGSVLGPFLFAVLTSPYRLSRFLTLMNPENDPQGAGWMAIQVNKVTHSAGLFGQGFNFNPRTIPEVHTDFIFTYIVYTFGWIAGIILGALFITFLIRLARIAIVVKNTYGKLLVSGLVSVFAVQFIWNILMNLSLAPIFGVGLPFISFGGSQFIFSMLAIGIITNIYKWKNDANGCS